VGQYDQSAIGETVKRRGVVFGVGGGEKALIILAYLSENWGGFNQQKDTKRGPKVD